MALECHRYIWFVFFWGGGAYIFAMSVCWCIFTILLTYIVKDSQNIACCDWLVSCFYPVPSGIYLVFVLRYYIESFFLYDIFMLSVLCSPESNAIYVMREKIDEEKSVAACQWVELINRGPWALVPYFRPHISRLVSRSITSTTHTASDLRNHITALSASQIACQRWQVNLYIGQAFRYSPEKAFCIFNQQIYFIIWYLLDRASLI